LAVCVAGDFIIDNGILGTVIENELELDSEPELDKQCESAPSRDDKLLTATADRLNRG